MGLLQSQGLSVGRASVRRPVDWHGPIEYRRAVLLLRAKTVLVSGHPIRLFSFDGKTWFSTAKSYSEFKRRRVYEKELSKTVSKLIRALPVKLRPDERLVRVRSDDTLTEISQDAQHEKGAASAVKA
jgi:hypothetical protein